MCNLYSITMTRAAIIVALGAGLMMMPAYSQNPPPRSVIIMRPDQQHINFFRDLTIKAAREAVQDNAARVEITTLMVGIDVPDGAIVENYSHPYACGYVTPSYGRSSQRFIYFYSKAQLFASLKDQALVDAMADCHFLPGPPPPPTDNRPWGNLKY
jgi:hypothetical protein